jgi:F-BAR and double SH3 domains protein
LAACQALRDAGYRNDPNDPDLETKIDEFREAIRKSEVAKAKSESRIECLRLGGINVEDWIQEAEILSVQEMPRSSSSLSMRTDASGQGVGRFLNIYFMTLLFYCCFFFKENPSSDSFYDNPE